MPQREANHIKIFTALGRRIPEVTRLKVLGMIIDKNNSNGETLAKLNSKTAEAIRLIRCISTRRTGMKEDNLVRHAQSIVISHITYVAAYHNWRVMEQSKINTLIRKDAAMA